MKRKAILFTIVLITLALSTGFSVAAEKLTFGLSISTQVNPFYKAMADGMKEQCKTMGIEAYALSADDKLAKQISDVEDLIQKKIDVLLINATQSGAQAVIEKAAKAGIKVVTLQRQIPSSAVSAHVGTDNVVIGMMGANWVVDTLGGKGNVVVLEGIPGAASSAW